MKSLTSKFLQRGKSVYVRTCLCVYVVWLPSFCIIASDCLIQRLYLNPGIPHYLSTEVQDWKSGNVNTYARKHVNTLMPLLTSLRRFPARVWLEMIPEHSRYIS